MLLFRLFKPSCVWAIFLRRSFCLPNTRSKPRRAVLVLASGFVFSGLFAFLQTLAFPGAYAPAGLIGDRLNSPGWLFVLWHTTFPLAVIVYALSKEAPTSSSNLAGRSGLAGLTWVATAGAAHLPTLYVNEINQAPFTNYVNVYLSLLSAAAIVLLFVRRRTILDQWLIVTLLAWLPNFVVSVLFTVVRFTVGW